MMLKRSVKLPFGESYKADSLILPKLYILHKYRGLKEFSRDAVFFSCNPEFDTCESKKWLQTQ